MGFELIPFFFSSILLCVCMHLLGDWSYWMVASRHQQYSCLCLHRVEVMCTCSLFWIFYVQAATQTQVLTGMQQVSLHTFPLNYHFTNSLFYLSKWIVIRMNMTYLRH